MLATRRIDQSLRSKRLASCPWIDKKGDGKKRTRKKKDRSISAEKKICPLNNAQALGYGVMWKTGAAAYDANVKAMFELAPEDHIVAFLYLGTTAAPGPLVPVSTDGIVSWRS